MLIHEDFDLACPRSKQPLLSRECTVRRTICALLWPARHRLIRYVLARRRVINALPADTAPTLLLPPSAPAVTSAQLDQLLLPSALQAAFAPLVRLLLHHARVGHTAQQEPV